MSVIDPERAGVRIPHDIHPEVIAEAAELSAEGYDVRLDDTRDRFALDPATQLQVDADIAQMELDTKRALDAGLPNPLLLPVGRPAFGNWAPLTKRAIALNNIYAPQARTLGEGIDPGVYDRKLFAVEEGGLSAVEVVGLMRGAEKAEKIRDQYRAFVPTVIDERSRLIWAGARDGAGVRTRATAAMDEAVRHLSMQERGDDDEGIVSLSLACGAAAPVYELMSSLEANGVKVRKTVLADMDPMALASAYSIAETKNVEDKIELKLENLVNMETGEARDLTELVDPESVDAVDLLGLFEYFPRDLAVSVLKQVKSVLKPNGIIVFGNMIDKRPQQTFFSDVSLWPSLFQRSLTELFDIIDEAGFDAKNEASILLPPQGVYSVISVTPGRKRTETQHLSEASNVADSQAIAAGTGVLAVASANTAS